MNTILFPLLTLLEQRADLRRSVARTGDGGLNAALKKRVDSASGSELSADQLLQVEGVLKKLTKMQTGQIDHPRDDEIPAMRLLNRGRSLLGQGKTREAIELIRAADALDRTTFDCFLIGLDGAFSLNDPKDSGIRNNVDDEVLAFTDEMVGAEATSYIRKARDNYQKARAARRS